MGRRFMSSGFNLSVVDTGDFLQIRNGSNQTVEITELQIYQTTDLVFAENQIRIRRGTGGAGGFGHTEWQYDATGAPSGVTAHQVPTSDVSAIDWEEIHGWDIFSPFSWLPTEENILESTEENILELASGDHLGISLGVGVTMGVGFFITYEETGIS